MNLVVTETMKMALLYKKMVKQMYMFPIAEFGEQMHCAKFYEQYWKTEPGKQKIPRIVV